MTEDHVERRNLFSWIVHARDPAQGVCGNTGARSDVTGGQDAPANLRRQAKQGQDLGHAGAGDAFATGDGGLVGELASVELASPLDGLAERFGEP